MTTSNGFEAIQATVEEQVQTWNHFPDLFTKGVTFFQKARIYYRSFKHIQYQKEAVENPQKGNPAVYGAAIDFIAQFHSITECALYIALIVKFTQDILLEYKNLKDQYEQLRSTWKNEYPFHRTVTWPSHRSHLILSILFPPSASLAWKMRLANTVHKIKHMTHTLWAILCQMFKISMISCDVYYLLKGDLAIRYEACTELVAKWDDYKDFLKGNEKVLLEKLEGKKEIATRLFTKLGISETIVTVTEKLKALFTTEIPSTSGALNHLSDALKQARKSVYVKGKITPFEIGIPQQDPIFPRTHPYRYPPWGGQTLEGVED